MRIFGVFTLLTAERMHHFVYKLNLPQQIYGSFAHVRGFALCRAFACNFLKETLPKVKEIRCMCPAQRPTLLKLRRQFLNAVSRCGHRISKNVYTHQQIKTPCRNAMARGFEDDYCKNFAPKLLAVFLNRARIHAVATNAHF